MEHQHIQLCCIVIVIFGCRTEHFPSGINKELQQSYVRSFSQKPLKDGLDTEEEPGAFTLTYH